jgi:hypothetical protein
MGQRRRTSAGVIVRSEHDALFRGRGCERRVWARRLERGCGGREDIAFVLRRVVGDEDDRRCAAGSAAIVMRVSILIGVGDGERAGRTPSKVSTMIIRPPQQGQRRPDESPSVFYEQGLRRNNWLRIRISRRDGERKMQRSKSRGSTSKFLSPTLPCTILSTSNAISRQLNHTTCSAPRR